MELNCHNIQVEEVRSYVLVYMLRDRFNVWSVSVVLDGPVVT